jgi:hypothetical protein
MGAILALIIIAAFGTGLLVYFHLTDNKNRGVELSN